MKRITSHLVSGIACIVIGGGLALFTRDITTPIFTLTKVGVVLLVIGGIDLAYAAYLAITPKHK